MKKIFLSADIEGTAGIVHWDETETGKPLYDRFARQMTREVAAACQGAMAAGAGEILVKDAHDTGRNLDPEQLPPCARIFRGWGRDPYSMMGGLERDFDGVVFTGYHSAADTDGNPLAHTMNLGIDRLTINGETAPELLINSLTAAYLGVPVRFVSGDEALCRWMHRMCPGTVTVATNRGVGNGAVCLHPDEAVERIRAGVEEALHRPKAECLFPLPEAFEVEVRYRQHFMAHRAGFYPGARQTGPRTVAFRHNDYFQVLTFFAFVL